MSKMGKTNSIIILLLASVLLSGVCFSLLTADIPEYLTAPNQALTNFQGGENSEFIGDEITFESNLPLVAAAIVLSIIVGVLSAIVCFIKFNDSRK
jgi:ABC-type antimicrobial peptide transport system permease subunit